MARDKGLWPPLAKQILVYPMIDDRNVVVNETMGPFVFWKTEDNATAWTALLGVKASDPEARPPCRLMQPQPGLEAWRVFHRRTWMWAAWISFATKV